MASKLAAPLLFSFLAAGLVTAAEYKGKDVTFSIRPKAGVLVPFEGDWDEVLDTLFHGELGFKSTVENWGFELAGGVRYAQQSYQGIDFDAVLGVVKFTGTFELNPMAGYERGHGPANLYAGIGMGIYPSEVETTLTVDGTPVSGKDSFFGYGPHAVLGGELYLSHAVGLFAELQYAYTIFRIDPGVPDLDLHAVSLLLGLSLRF